MKCRPGDMAVVIDDPDFKQEGAFVTVIKAGEDDGAWLCRGAQPLRFWRVYVWFGVVVMKRPTKGRECEIPDECLQPIRGLTQNETVNREVETV